jgi:hypothetical protein
MSISAASEIARPLAYNAGVAGSNPVRPPTKVQVRGYSTLRH